MKRSSVLTSCLFLLCVLLLNTSIPLVQAVELNLHAEDLSASAELAARRQLHENAHALRIPWVQNQGQVHEDVLYYADTFAGRVFVTEHDITYNVQGNANNALSEIEQMESILQDEVPRTNAVAVKETFVESTYEFSPQATGQTEAVVSYLKGRTEQEWQKAVPTFQAVEMGRVWEKIDLSLRAYGNNKAKKHI